MHHHLAHYSASVSLMSAVWHAGRHRVTTATSFLQPVTSINECNAGTATAIQAKEMLCRQKETQCRQSKCNAGNDKCNAGKGRYNARHGQAAGGGWGGAHINSIWLPLKLEDLGAMAAKGCQVQPCEGVCAHKVCIQPPVLHCLQGTLPLSLS